MKDKPNVLTQDKHMLLDDAIDGIDEVGQYAYDILQRIQGNGSDVGGDKECDKNRSNLQDVLDNGHNKINTKMTEIRNTLAEIEAAIF